MTSGRGRFPNFSGRESNCQFDSSLTPGLSFAHNLGCRCPNGQCEASLDIYTSRSFQWHQKHPNARCFGPSTRTLNFWESRRTPSSHFWECGLHPHTYPKVGLRQLRHMVWLQNHVWPSNNKYWMCQKIEIYIYEKNLLFKCMDLRVMCSQLSLEKKSFEYNLKI
jgi:hypothetical protein